MVDSEFLPGKYIVRDQLNSGILTAHDGIVADDVLYVLMGFCKQADLDAVIMAVHNGVVLNGNITAGFLLIGANIEVETIVTIVFHEIVTDISTAGTFKAHCIEIVDKMIFSYRDVREDVQRMISVLHVKSTDLYAVSRDREERFIPRINDGVVDDRFVSCGLPLGGNGDRLVNDNFVFTIGARRDYDPVSTDGPVNRQRDRCGIRRNFYDVARSGTGVRPLFMDE